MDGSLVMLSLFDVPVSLASTGAEGAAALVASVNVRLDAALLLWAVSCSSIDTV